MARKVSIMELLTDQYRKPGKDEIRKLMEGKRWTGKEFAILTGNRASGDRQTQRYLTGEQGLKDALWALAQLAGGVHETLVLVPRDPAQAAALGMKLEFIEPATAPAPDAAAAAS
jgi:hypothetical protein